ncbi:ABC transporter G member 22 [Dinochytrium kinnereticum]|nr:ABC transporter G member 22 [Dinochytrium kinnereticum]
MSGKKIGYYLSWENISCVIGGKSILENVSGYCAPGTSVAVLGASGSGKTTLVGTYPSPQLMTCFKSDPSSQKDILAQRKTVGTISGEVLVNGMKLDKRIGRRLGYVAAETVHIPTQTVRETLMFAAKLRMPAACTDLERVTKVEEILVGLKLDHIGDTPVGNELLRGISSGEKKRLDIAIEMLAEPKLLFLDEPTSGLDEYAARFTMRLILQYIKEQSVTVICVIHQPSYSVYQLFDSICLLGAAKVCYFGKVSYAETYFTKMGQPTPQFVNPIEHYLDVISAAPVEVSRYYELSEFRSQIAQKVREISQVVGSVELFETDLNSKPMYERSDFMQFWLLFIRCGKRYYRNPSTSFGRLALAIVLSLIFGGVFFNLGYDLESFRMRLGLASGMGFIPSFMAAAALPQFLEDRDLFHQEYASGFYRVLPYYLSYLFLESVILIVITIIQAVIIFYMSNMGAATFNKYLLTLILQSLISVSVAQFISAWCKTLMQAYSALVAYGLFNFVFSGVQANFTKLNNPFLTGLTYICYWRYTITYLISNQLKEFVIQCKPNEMIPVKMNTIVKQIAQTVQGVLTSTMPNNKDKAKLASQIATYLEIASLGWIDGILSVDAVTGLVGVNPAKLPLPPPTDTMTFGPDVKAEVGSAMINTIGVAGLTSAAEATAYATNSSGWSIWNQTIGLADQSAFPDYSRCFITDTAAYIRQKFAVDDMVNDSVFGIAMTFFAVYCILTYAGLFFSMRFKKR